MSGLILLVLIIRCVNVEHSCVYCSLTGWCCACINIRETSFLSTLFLAKPPLSTTPYQLYHFHIHSNSHQIVCSHIIQHILYYCAALCTTMHDGTISTRAHAPSIKRVCTTKHTISPSVFKTKVARKFIVIYKRARASVSMLCECVC